MGLARIGIFHFSSPVAAVGACAMHKSIKAVVYLPIVGSRMIG